MSTKNPTIAPRRQTLAPSPIDSARSPPVMMAPRAPVTQETKGSESKASTPQIITSKEWVLPPRPKPGRKPSVDTPASKRKAQNRAAQRAFRERRATRVQELEEQLLEFEKERDVKEMGLINTINKLKVENQFLLKSIEQMRSEMNSMKESQSPSYTLQFNIPQFKLNYNNAGSPLNQMSGSPASSSYSVQQQVSPAPSADSPTFVGSFRPSISNINLTSDSSSPAKVNKTGSVNNNFDCGVCVKEECLCETVGLKEKSSENTSATSSRSLEETISSFKPMPAVSLNKKRKSSDNEVDFTKKFALKKAMPDLKKLKHEPIISEVQIIHEKKKDSIVEFDESSPVENCGFCTDDTPCVCREAAKEAARLNKSLDNGLSIEDDTKTSLPPIQLNSNSFAKAALPVMHPGPSVEIREITNLTPGAVPTVATPTTRPGSIVKDVDNDSLTKETKKSGCTGNPGTCEQCQMDPMSTLFCTTVASRAKSDSSISSDSSTSKSGSTQDSISDSRTSLSSTPLVNQQQSVTGTFIPCSDAYKTLSRHKKFNSVDFGTLVGKLTTRGMQVEVQSVANVLRELDRRLYN